MLGTKDGSDPGSVLGRGSIRGWIDGNFGREEGSRKDEERERGAAVRVMMDEIETVCGREEEGNGA